MGKIIFADFDGTVTKQDTCDAIVMAFAREGWKEINRLWEERKISTQECANQTFELFDAGLDDVKNLLDTIKIDDYFKQFLSFCERKGYRVYILSDGYDLNIETVFKNYDISVPYFANHLAINNGFKMECPNQGENCKICGTCKLELMKKLMKAGDRVIYIGDGYSDACPAMSADIVFAKNTLYRICAEKGINPIPFTSFKDIMDSGMV